MKRILFALCLVACIFLIDPLAPKTALADGEIDPCGSIHHFYAASIPPFYECQPPSGTGTVDIKVPIPMIPRHDPSYAAIVGIQYYWSIGYDPSTFTYARVDCSHGPCGLIGAPGEYKTDGDNEGSIKYTNLRSIVWVEAERSPSPACIANRNYSMRIDHGGAEDFCASGAAFNSGSRLTWSANPLEIFICAGQWGCPAKNSPRSRQYLDNELGRGTLSASNAAYHFTVVDPTTEWYWFVSAESSNQGPGSGLHGEPAFNLSVSSTWSIRAIAVWDKKEIMKKIYYTYNSMCPDILGNDTIPCTKTSWYLDWRPFNGGGPGQTLEKIEIPLYNEYLISANDLKSKYATIYPVEVFQSQALLEPPQ